MRAWGGRGCYEVPPLAGEAAKCFGHVEKQTTFVCRSTGVNIEISVAKCWRAKDSCTSLAHDLVILQVQHTCHQCCTKSTDKGRNRLVQVHRKRPQLRAKRAPWSELDHLNVQDKHRDGKYECTPFTPLHYTLFA